jgi:hypothetical protein
MCACTVALSNTCPALTTGAERPEARTNSALTPGLFRWSIVFSRNDIGAAFTSSSPALSHTFYNAGAAGLNAYEIGDLVPSAAPGAETISWATAASIASIGVTILPPDILQAQACL